MIDYRSIVTLALKLLGLWLIVQGATTFAQILPTLVRSSLPTDERLSYAAWVLAPFVFGGFLWLFPARLANTIVHPEVPASGGGPEWAVRLEQIGMSLLGLYLLYHALSGLAYHVTIYRAQRAVDAYALHMFYPTFAARIVEAVVALVLVLRSEGIVGALARLRAAGVRRTPAGSP
jgi:hypothetical protein